MIDITNKLFQPLSYQLADGTGLHLPPRGHAQISERQLSAELRRAAQRGIVQLQSPPPAPPRPSKKTKEEG